MVRYLCKMKAKSHHFALSFLITLQISCGMVLLSTTAHGQIWSLDSEEYKVGDKLIARLIFDLDKSTIRLENNPLLDSIATFMKANPGVVIEVGQHMDKRWSDEYSYRLDAVRARSIAVYLQNQGIDPLRLQAKGYEDDQPLITEEEIAAMGDEDAKEAAHYQNRRTEFKILQVDFEER